MLTSFIDKENDVSNELFCSVTQPVSDSLMTSGSSYDSCIQNFELQFLSWKFKEMSGLEKTF